MLRLRHQSAPGKSQTIRPLSFLLLQLWVGLAGVTALGWSRSAIAEDLIIPESPAAETVPFDPEPPAPEPAAISPDPVAPAYEPEPAPDVAPPPPVAVEAPPEPAPTQASDPYIDTQDYSVGATEPYNPPDEIVVNDRTSGCQATLSAGQAIAASLCGPPPAEQRYAMPSTLSQEAPAWASSESTGWNAADSSPVSAETVQNTLRYAAVPPQNLVVKPLTSANPLKWIMPNGERMIFPLPIPVDITSVFGWRIHPITGEWRFHSGTDLGAPMGTPVLAAYSGKVSLAEVLGGYGLSILLDHNQGKAETRYAHLSDVFVKPGQWVQQGTVIGLVGSTGNSTGPHLHFETLEQTPDGMVAIDPNASLQITLAELARALQTARLVVESAAKQG